MKKLTSFLAIVGLLAVLLSCKNKKAAGEDCASNSDCKEGLGCYIIGHQFKCLTQERADEACKASPNCTSKGECNAKPGQYNGDCVK